jgi:hypothetical protein
MPFAKKKESLPNSSKQQNAKIKQQKDQNQQSKRHLFLRSYSNPERIYDKRR